MKIETRKRCDYSAFTTLETVYTEGVEIMNNDIHLFVLLSIIEIDL